MRRFSIPSVLFFILGASAALALLSGCGNSTNSSSSSNSNLKPGCSANIGAGANGAAPSSIDVVTYHYDNLRTGRNTKETMLTLANVNSAQFGKLGEFTVAGKVDAQPLYLSNVSIPGSVSVCQTETLPLN